MSDTPRTDAVAHFSHGGAEELKSAYVALVDLARELERANGSLLEEAAKIAERHYIPGHSVAGPGFAKIGADAIRALAPREQDQMAHKGEGKT